MPRAGDPTVVIDAAVAEHLEILRGAALAGLRVISRIKHGHAIHQALLHAVDRFWLRNFCGFERGGRDVNDVMKLAADFAPGFDAFRPMHHHAVARAAKVRGDLFGPLERRVTRPGPADGKMRERVRTTQVASHFGGTRNGMVMHWPKG